MSSSIVYPEYTTPSDRYPSLMETRLEVWIDGDCAVCRRSQRWCAARDHDRRLSFTDLHSSGGVEPPADREAMLHEVHVRRPDGSVATGYDGWLLVLAELPGWSRLAAVAGWSPLCRIGPFFYAAIAKTRHHISRILND